MELLDKKIINKFGTHYLLGEDKDGTKYWLEEPTFDCGWYWGGLYVHAYSNNRQPTRSIDIDSHEHFDSKFLSKGYDEYRDFFKKSVLDGNEIWKLLELAKTFYILKDAADLFERGGAHITRNDCYDVIKDQDTYLDVIKVKLPAVISEICNLLGGKTTREQFSKQAVYKEN
jgi:hypothetical protein